MRKIFYSLLLLGALGACGLPQPHLNTISIQAESPEKSVLVDYLTSLQLKNYIKASSDYGGDYSLLMFLIPEVKSDFKSKFFEIYCLKKKGACLNYQILSEEQLSGNVSKFRVQFLYNDGSIFPAGDCPCQAGKKQNIFDFRVNKTGNEFKVMDLPPREL